MLNIGVFRDVKSCRLMYCQVHSGGTEFFRNVRRYLPIDKHRSEELRDVIKHKIHSIRVTMTRR